MEVCRLTVIIKTEVPKASQVVNCHFLSDFSKLGQFQVKGIIGNNRNAELSHVTRTRIFVADITQGEIAGKAHGEYFGGIRPATSMVAVSGLISPEMMVEIEADAFVPDVTEGVKTMESCLHS
jgi:Endoribonuclease L-PSP